MVPDWVPYIVSPSVGWVGGFIGSWMGIKISLVRLEVKVDIHDKAINRLTGDVAKVNEDILVFDGELEQLMSRANLRRINRQRLR